MRVHKYAKMSEGNGMTNITVKNIKFYKLNISKLIYLHGNKAKNLKFKVHCTNSKCCKYNCPANSCSN